MSFALTDYRAIPSSGILPTALVPADQISFGFSFTYEKDVNLEEGLQSSLAGHIVLELRDGAGQLKATFDFKETYHVTLFPLAPGLALFTWNWDSNLEQFSATDSAGGVIPTEGAFSLGAIPAGDSGTTDKTAIINSTFYSAIWDVNVSAGDTLRIKFHNLSAGFVVAHASLKVATRSASTPSPAHFDERLGVQLRAVVEKGQTRVVRSRRSNSPLLSAQVEWSGAGAEGLVTKQALRAVRLGMASGGQTLLFGASGTALELWRSQNGGKDWVSMMNQPSTLSPLASCFSRDGATLLVYGLQNKLPTFALLKNGAKGWTIAQGGACVLESAPKETPSLGLPLSTVNSLEVGEGGAYRLMASDSKGAFTLFLSRDGKSWSATPLQKAGDS